jgi:Glycosyltransferase WbsX/Domain of unknown function (DUF4214)
MTAKKPSLRELFAAHSGKVSDKWDIYISEYDRLFQPYRDKPLRLLEIGIQNGGSLEVWSKYFVQAKRIVGSDIDPACEQLTFDDPKIAIVVADANTDDAEQRILAASNGFDLIIDDGSHRSSDIVQSFARYFKHLTDGGLYIAEDLHCSYWQDFEGGIFQPYSSIAFFKQLADTVNHEHWGTDKTRSSLLKDFTEKYSLNLEEDLLAEVHSVEFVNSICVIRKERKQSNLLGIRVIAGSTALVWNGALQLHGSSGLRQDQTTNPWATKNTKIEDDLLLRNEDIKKLTEITQQHEQELTQVRDDSKQSVQVYLVELDRLRNDAHASLNRLKENEKLSTERIDAMQLMHEAQIIELKRSYGIQEQIKQVELAKAHKEVESLSLQIDSHLNKISKQEQEFNSHIEAITATFEITKKKFTCSELSYVERLNISTQRIEGYLIQIFNLEKDFSRKIQDLQIAAITQEQGHAAQLLELNKTFTSQIRELKNSNEERLILQRDDFSTREQNLWAHVEAEKLRFSIQANAWSEKEKIHSLHNDALARDLQAIYTSRFWKLTAPIRKLSDRLPHTPIKISTSDKSLPKLDSTSSAYVAMRKRDPSDNPSLPIQHPTTMTSNTVPHTHGESTMNLTEMVSHQDEEFVQNAYHVLLARAADPQGLRHYLTRVQAGTSKVEILAEISLSKEGRQLNVEVPGLKKEIKRYRLLRTPVLGRIFKAWGLSLMDGKVENNIRVIENKLVNLEATMAQQIGQLTQAVIAGNQKSLSAPSTNTLATRPQVSRPPLVLRGSPQTVKVPSSAPLAKTSTQATSNITSVKAPTNGSASHLALSKNLDKAITNDRGILKDETKLIAFYLPQFHQTKENSEWWGPGFTEWTNTANGRPNFKGHYQPHIPRELGFYDLQNVEVMRAQSDLAKTYGVHGFCFYYYWFSGRRILERPLDNFLTSDIDMPFCLCWANENWTRTWDGDEKSVLLEQGYADGDEENFIKDILPFLKDARCIKVGDKPLLLIYRIKQLPDPIASIKKWRVAAVRAGLPGLHISVVDFYDISDPREVGADALVEFPPHKFNGPNNHPNPMPEFTNLSFAGGMIDYKKVVAQSKSRPQPDFTLYRGIIPGWDNTARRQDTPTTIIHNTPALYGEWLSYLRGYSRAAHSDDSSAMIFVNAWNEWGEGCHLEPDLHWGLAFLEETLRSSWYDTAAQSEHQHYKLRNYRE